MASSTDSKLNGYLSLIQRAEFGRDARGPIRSAVARCYDLAVSRVGSPRNGVTSSVINVHLNRIADAVFGEDVRDAIATALALCYSARGISVNSTENGYFSTIRECQLASDLKGSIVDAIIQCCRDVKA